MSRKDFKSRNEGFKCLKCGFVNEPAATSNRNHCCKCLYSQHVDLETPGDRKSDCGALMDPIKLDYNGKKGFMILHKCTKCGKEMWNRSAEDDDLSRA